MNEFKFNKTPPTRRKHSRDVGGGGAEHRFFHRLGQSGGDGWYRHQLFGGCGTDSEQIRNICLVQMV